MLRYSIFVYMLMRYLEFSDTSFFFFQNRLGFQKWQEPFLIGL